MYRIGRQISHPKNFVGASRVQGITYSRVWPFMQRSCNKSESTTSNMKPRPRKFRILSLDGGGVRGLFAAVVLQRLAELEPRIFKSIDLIAGTSTGAIIGCLLATGHSPGNIAEMYEQQCPNIFQKHRLRRLSPFHANQSSKSRDSIFRQFAKSTRFGDIKQPWLLVTAFNLDGVVDDGDRTTFFPAGRWRPALFTNMPKLRGAVNPDLELSLYDALMASTAAPVYFPTHGGYADGGVFANNPSLCAMTKVLAHLPELSHQDIAVLSIGTCVRQNKLDSRHFRHGGADWGMMQWSSVLLDLLYDSSNRAVNLHMAHLLGQNYCRINPLLQEDIPLDHATPESIAQLHALAYSVDLDPVQKFVRQHFVSGPVAAEVDWSKLPAGSETPVELLKPAALDRASFGDVLCTLQLGLTDAQTDKFFSSLDYDGDGLVDAKELIGILSKQSGDGFT